MQLHHLAAAMSLSHLLCMHVNVWLTEHVSCLRMLTHGIRRHVLYNQHQILIATIDACLQQP